MKSVFRNIPAKIWLSSVNDQIYLFKFCLLLLITDVVLRTDENDLFTYIRKILFYIINIFTEKVKNVRSKYWW